MKNKKSRINASALAMDDPVILGTYEGEALDTEITNKNGLDITAEVIETVLDSEEYADGIKNGWFIGFLGHPEDPNCMDFRNGCIVLTDMELQDNGKVYAKFNLVNTPVGQIVKTFQEAGVTFGISIRGAGDIVGNSVEPDTFMFRGFDLVAFPAYPESVPEYKAIAASTNPEDQKKYQAICAAVTKNVDAITSCAAIEAIQSQFAPQSKEYKLLASRKEAIKSNSDNVANTSINADTDITAQKIEAMTDLYLAELAKNKDLVAENRRLRSENRQTISACSRKITAMERMTDSQVGDLLSNLDRVTASCNSLEKRNRQLSNSLDSVKKSNLIYKQRVEACEDELTAKEAVIASLQSKLRETITASTKADKQSANLDDANRNLSKKLRDTQKELSNAQRITANTQKDLSAVERQLQTYQEAYTTFYASAVGVDPGSITITASTSPEEIRKMIDSATNTANVGTSADMVEDFYLYDDEDPDGIISV